MGYVLALAAALAFLGLWRIRIGFTDFRRRLRAHLERHSDVRWQRDTSAGMICSVLGYPLEADLLSTYVHARRHRANEPALFEEFVNALRGRVPPVNAPPFALVRDRILPIVKRARDIPPTRGYLRDNHIVIRPFDGDLVVAYVIEGQFVITYVTAGMLTAWNQPVNALHGLALTNLRARTNHILEEIGGPRSEYTALDGYDASRVLVADLIIPEGIRDPVVAIPHEHALLVADRHDAAELAGRAYREYARARLPLTPALYGVTADGPAPLTLPALEGNQHERSTGGANTETVSEVTGWTAHGATSLGSKT